MRDRLRLVAAVALGGALGALARWAMFRFSLSIAEVSWWSTIAVNAIGCLVMGLVVGLIIRRGRGSATFHAFLTTGLLGGFTTFSAFAVDAIRLGESYIWQAALYVVATVVISIGLVWLGLRVTVRRAQ
jgi:CrcB protein